jgi:hypothetical protein
LRRLEQRGLLRVETATSAGRRNRRVWHPTEDGLAEHLSWIRQPVQPERIAHDLPLHLMRFVLMEAVAPREDMLAFLASLIDGLEQFVKGTEAYADGAGRQLPGRHPLLALRHGIVMHQASLDWARATAAELAAELGGLIESTVRRAISSRAADGVEAEVAGERRAAEQFRAVA